MPELRPPAFRGALRYWLRAALGGVIGDQNTQRLYELESDVFGSAADEAGSASAVNVRLGGYRQVMPIGYSKLCEATPDGKRYNKSGLAYLLFSARKTGQDNERSGLQGEFDLVMSLRRNTQIGEMAFKRAYAAFWLLSHFGGVGTRTHRGIGAFSVKSLEETEVGELTQQLPLIVKAQNPQQLASEYKNGLDTMRQIIGDDLPTAKVAHTPAFDVLEASTCKIWVIDHEYTDGVNALDEFGRIYQAFRALRPPDYATIKSSLTSGQNMTQSVKRAAFGLPIPYYYRSLNGEQATLQSEHSDRRSSPLWVRPVLLANQKVVLVLLWFKSQFLPESERLRLKPKDRHKNDTYGSVPDDVLITQFITGKDNLKHSSLADVGLKVIEVPYA